MKKDRYAKAWDSLILLRRDPIQAARDIYYIHAQLSIESEIVGRTSYIKRFSELATIPRVRRATIAAFTVMIAQQMCGKSLDAPGFIRVPERAVAPMPLSTTPADRDKPGINIIAFYSTTVFVDAGYTQHNAMICSFGFGLVNWLFAFPAFYTIDTFGRRSLLLFTFPQMMWTLLAAGLCTLMDQGTARTALAALFVFLFAAFYSPGEGPVPFTYSAEVFPLSHREMGMGFAVATCLFWAAILGMTFPFLLERAGTVGAFGVYAGFNFVAFVMIFFLVPETKQRTLEELDYIFAVPIRKFAHYQVTKALPWWLKRYVLFRRRATLEPLYHEDDRPVADARTATVVNKESDMVAS